MSYIQQAFETVCKEAITPEAWYVSLVEEERYYGGPEEGGWWGSDYKVIAYKEFPSEELAEQAKSAVLKLARELEENSRTEYGRQCLREMEWLDARGLDSDFLPEPDGPSKFYVQVSQELPVDTYGSRHYE